MAQTTGDRQSFWRHWVEYCGGFTVKVNPYLHMENFETINKSVACFAGWVRTGALGNRRQVSCARIQTAIRAINETFQLNRGTYPLYQATEKYLKPIELMFAGFAKEDKAPVPHIVVLVGVPEQCDPMGLCSAAKTKEQVVGGSVLI